MSESRNRIGRSSPRPDLRVREKRKDVLVESLPMMGTIGTPVVLQLDMRSSPPRIRDALSQTGRRF